MQFLKQTLAGNLIDPVRGKTDSLHWHRPVPGIIIFEPRQRCEKSVVVSVGIHGNETAPIEIIAQLIEDILNGRCKLNVRLMVIFGNLQALRHGQRYERIDLNRLFSGHHRQFENCAETQRAAALEQLVGDFYEPAEKHLRFHFDLHTAIKPSRHLRFGVLPYVSTGHYHPEMVRWLKIIGIEALVVHQAPGATFSAFTSQELGASSCTLELGKALPFGHNDLTLFTGIRDGVRAFITQTDMVDQSTSEVCVYQVTQELTKLSEAFSLQFSDSVKNFTPFPRGFLLATDNQVTYRVEEEEGYILFPNNQVQVGFRAGLLLGKGNWLDLVDMGVQ
jgi:succinylglutamate desuccinylase